MHDEVMSSNLSQSRFEKCFANLSGDFGISFEGTKNILSVPRHDVVQYCNVVMFFGKQFGQMRPWGPVFWLKNDPDAHHVFRSFVSEYFGDSRASPQLFAVYKDCMCMIYCEHVTKLYMDGWREINQSKVREVRRVARDRVIRKWDVTKYIMIQVKEMKPNQVQWWCAARMLWWRYHRGHLICMYYGLLIIE